MDSDDAQNNEGIGASHPKKQLIHSVVGQDSSDL